MVQIGELSVSRYEEVVLIGIKDAATTLDEEGVSTFIATLTVMVDRLQSAAKPDPFARLASVLDTALGRTHGSVPVACEDEQKAAPVGDGVGECSEE